MKKIISHTSVIIILTFSILSISSCSNRADTVSCFPDTPINVTINLSLPAYYAIQNANGWVYIDEQQAGTRGLIVVRNGNDFKAYDRNAPHLCPDSNTTLEVKNGTSIICPKDNAEWFLLTGQPTAVATVPPKTYPVTYNASANTLQIFY